MNILRYALLLLLALSWTKVIASSSSINLALPNAGGSYGTDRIKAGDLDCTNSIGGSTNFEFGFTGVINNAVTFLGDVDLLNRRAYLTCNNSVNQRGKQHNSNRDSDP